MTRSVLIVGCGNIAGGYDADGDSGQIRTHAKAFLSHGGFELTACVDPDPGRRAAFAARWGCARTYDSLDAVTGRSFDVVSLCSPAELHAEQLRQLLEWPVGLVYCEKPLTLDVAASRAIVEAYEKAGRPLAVNYQRRWDRAVRQLQTEDWGDLLAARWLYTKGIQTNGSHLIDLAQALLGPLRAEAVTDIVEDYQPHDPTLGAILRTRSGAPLVLSVGDRRCFTVFELDLLFAEGRVTFGDAGYSWCRRKVHDDPRYAGYRVLAPADWQPTGLDQAFADAVANIHDVLDGRSALRSSGRTALEAQEICADLIRLATRHKETLS